MARTLPRPAKALTRAQDVLKYVGSLVTQVSLVVKAVGIHDDAGAGNLLHRCQLHGLTVSMIRKGEGSESS